MIRSYEKGFFYSVFRAFLFKIKCNGCRLHFSSAYSIAFRLLDTRELLLSPDRSYPTSHDPQDGSFSGSKGHGSRSVLLGTRDPALPVILQVEIDAAASAREAEQRIRDHTRVEQVE